MRKKRLTEGRKSRREKLLDKKSYLRLKLRQERLLWPLPHQLFLILKKR